MNTIAKLSKEYGGFFGTLSSFGLLAVLITGAFLIFHIDSAKASTEITSDCTYADEEILDNGLKVCYYDCNDGTKTIEISEFAKCPHVD